MTVPAARPPTRLALAVAAAALLVLPACTGDGGPAGAAASTAPPVTSTTAGDPSIPTLPPDALDDVGDGAVGNPDPALPVDMVPVPFAVGALASLGDVQLVVDGIATDGDGQASTVTVTARVRNASLAPVQFSPDSFRVYAASGRSFAVASPDDGFFAGPVGADQWAPVALRFDVAAGQRPVLLVFDGAAYGDRVFSGGVVLEQ